MGKFCLFPFGYNMIIKSRLFDMWQIYAVPIWEYLSVE